MNRGRREKVKRNIKNITDSETIFGWRTKMKTKCF